MYIKSFIFYIFNILFSIFNYSIFAEYVNPSIGYSCFNSDTHLSCKYDWIDISNTGILLNLNTDLKQEYVLITLPFSFDFNGNIYNDVWIRTEGILCFGEENGTFKEAIGMQIPNPFNKPDNFIGIDYRNHQIVGNDTMYAKYQIFGVNPNRYFVILFHTWGDVDGDSEYYSVEIILFENSNKIKFQYKNDNQNIYFIPYGTKTTVGIENEWGDGGIEYLYNGTPSDRLIHNELAIEFVPRRGVFLSPAEIQKKSTQGAVESFAVHLKNLTGYEAQFHLETVGNKFPARILDYPTTGTEIFATPLIPNGSSFTLYPEVHIPQNIPFFYTDRLAIVATDMSDLTTSQTMLIHTTPEQQNWEIMDDMPDYCDLGVCERIGDKIIINGGWDTVECSKKTVIYDPVEETFLDAAQKSVGTYASASAAVGNKIYVMGGSNTGYFELISDVQIYDTLLNTWTEGENLPSEYWGWASAESYGEKIYYVGGAANKKSITSIESYVYDNGWWRLADLNKNRCANSISLVGDILFTMGGFENRDYWSSIRGTFEKYNISENRWIQIDSMQKERASLGAKGFGRYVYVFGGGEYDPGPLFKEHQVGERFGDVYNSIEPCWVYTPEFNDYGRAGFCSALMEIGGKYYLYAIGGGGWGYYRKRVERLMIWDGNLADREFKNDASDFLFSGKIGELTAPIDFVDTQGLMMIAANNANCFGFWCGPFSVNREQLSINNNSLCPSVLELKKSVESAESVVSEENIISKSFFDVSSEYIYRVRATVSTDEPDRSKVPEFRLRIGNMDFLWWYVYGVNSSGIGGDSPTTDGVVYQQYFVAPERVCFTPMTAAFDLLNIDPNNSPNASLSLKNLDIDYIPIEQSYDKKLRGRFSFESGTEGFQHGSGAPLTPTIGEWSPGELLITAINNTNSFGYWNRQLSEIPILPYRLYAMKVELYAEPPENGYFPDVRIRLAESRNGQYAMTVYTSQPNSIGPGASGTNGHFTGWLYFLPLESLYPEKYHCPSEIEPSPLYCAIDLLNINPHCPPTTTLHILSIEIYTINLHRL